MGARTDKPHDAPSVVLCRGELFASPNSSGITRIDPTEMRVLEVHDYPDVGIMHQLTPDGRMLYVAYFIEACPNETPVPCTPYPTHGILKTVSPMMMTSLNTVLTRARFS